MTRTTRVRPSLIALVALLAALVAAPSALAAPAWLSPADLGPATINFAPAFGYHDVAVAPDGTVVVVYAPGVEGAPAGTNTLQAQVRPPGGSFLAPQQLSSPVANRSVSGPAVAVDASGNFIAVWSESNGTNAIVRAALKPAGSTTFESSMDLSGTGQNASAPDVAISGGAAIAVWTRSNGVNNIVQQAVKPAGSSFFGSAGDLSAGGANASSAKVEMNAAGSAIVGWQRINGSSQAVVQAAFRPAGGSFTTLADVYTNVTPGGHVDGPQVAIAPDDRATIAWASYDTTRHTILSAARGTSGNFGGLDTVSDPTVDSGSSGYFDVAVDTENTAVIVWNAAVVQASTRPSGGSFSNSIQTLSQPATFTGNPAVAFAPDGRAIAVWQGASGSIPAIQAAEMPKGGQFGGVTDIEADPGSGVGYWGPTPLGIDGQGNAATIYAKQFDADPGAPVTIKYNHRIAGYDGAAPSLGAVSVPGTGTAGSAVAMSASASDIWSALTLTWAFGDGGSATGGSVSHTYGAAGSYTVTVTATDALGNASSTTRTIQVAAKPPAPKPKPLGSSFPSKWSVFKAFTTVVKLEVKSLPAGSKVKLTCKGGGCPLKAKTITIKKKTAKLKLTKYFNFKKKGKPVVSKLKPGAIVGIAVSKPGSIGRWFKATIRQGPKAPKIARGCLAAGSTSKKVTCPK